MIDWFFRVQVQIHAQKFNDHKSDPKLLNHYFVPSRQVNFVQDQTLINHYLLLIFIGKFCTGSDVN
jgi:hypothetical protein